MKNILLVFSLLSVFVFTSCLDKSDDPKPSTINTVTTTQPTPEQVKQFKVSNLNGQTWVVAGKTSTVQDPQSIENTLQTFYTFKNDSVVNWLRDLLPDSGDRDSFYLSTCSYDYFINDSLNYSHVFGKIELVRYNDTLFTTYDGLLYTNFIRYK